LTSRQDIENVIISYNKAHYQKAHNTNFYRDKICE